MIKHLLLGMAVIASITPAWAGTTQKIVTEKRCNYEVEGWEKPLVTRDPNLGRWYWGAMECSGRRSSTAVITASDKSKLGQRICYVKPIRLALPTVPRVTRPSNSAPTCREPAKSYRAYSTDRTCEHSYETKSATKLAGNLVNVGVRATIKKL